MFPTACLRRADALRSLVRKPVAAAQDLILPIFVEEQTDASAPVAQMPGVFRIPEARLPHEIEAIAWDGVRAVTLFGVSHHRDSVGGDTLHAGVLLARMTRMAKATSELVVVADNCLCEYAEHGHCGVLGHESGERSRGCRRADGEARPR